MKPLNLYQGNYSFRVTLMLISLALSRWVNNGSKAGEDETLCFWDVFGPPVTDTRDFSSGNLLSMITNKMIET